jgi:hypothetical protein
LRNNWIQSGAKWWNPSTPPPPNWNPYEQLKTAALIRQ